MTLPEIYCVQTTWIEFGAILTPLPPMRRHFSLNSCSDFLSNPLRGRGLYTDFQKN